MKRTTPIATYRLQLRAELGFDDVASLAGYLAELGVSHVHLSPYLQAAPGSTHGYDVVDPTRVNHELGGERAHARMCRALREHGLGQVVDVVPNHMAISLPHNAWWWDVLENGPASLYAMYFDVDWSPPEARLQNKVLMPILGDHYGRVLEAGHVRLHREGASFTVRAYDDHVLPLAPESLDEPLSRAAARCRDDELAFLAEALGALPASTATDFDSIARRHRDKDVIFAYLARLLRAEPDVAATVDGILEEIGGDTEALDAMLERQNYRIAYWRTARHDLDYRRFFDINSLVGLRMSREEVFRDTHGLILKWVEQGEIDGLRIDHPDGLYDPEAYFRRLREDAPDAWIVGEKILEPGERLPESWPVDGSTGYDFLNECMGVLIDAEAEHALDEFYRRFTGDDTRDFHALVRDKKRQILRELLFSDLSRLAALFLEVCERHLRYRDYARDQLLDVLLEVVACMPVYRTYVRRGQHATPRDERYIHEAIEGARAARGEADDRAALDADLLDFLQRILRGEVPGELEWELVARFQQLSGPAMAKGLEDTAFYCYHRLVCLNEVGGDPGRFGRSLEDFHGYCAHVQQTHPCTMVATSTHDTKRSEDVRARLAVISEMPETWEAAVTRWSARVAHMWPEGMRDPAMEYLFYQTWVGAWPISAERLKAYMEKAAREAKLHTHWLHPHPEYEQALLDLCERAVSDAQLAADVGAFVDMLRRPGQLNALSQTLLKLTAPGVPDLYQGTETWSLSLVDPDNRREVPFARLHDALRRLREMTPEAIWEEADAGSPKLHVTREALALRHERPECFGAEAAYEPLFARGRQASRVIAYRRAGAVVVVAPRWRTGLGAGWGDTRLELGGGVWRNRLTGEPFHGDFLSLGEALARFPVALLERVP